MNAPLVIVGTGFAGYALLRALRQRDRRREIHLIGADEAAAYSKDQLSAGLARGRGADELVIATAEQMAYRFEATITPRRRVLALDLAGHVLRTDNPAQPEQAWSQLVLATGAEAIRPANLRGSDAAAVLTVGSLAEYAYLRSELAGRKRVAVVGGGILGCELAESLRRGGCEVTLLEPDPRLLGGGVPALCAERIAVALASAGVRIRTEDGVQRIERALDELHVTTLGGKVLDADVVVAALGSRPCVQAARAAGLDVAVGIVVDAALRASVEGIYALGGCAEFEGRVFKLQEDIDEGAQVLADVLTGHAARMRWKARVRRLNLECCAVALCEPPPVAGEWHESATARGVRALFHDRKGVLRGFALVGDPVGESAGLLGRVAR
ncbi:NAD(P)/FAD-dependent oxidoreductase [Aromatoleum toluclasticum]|uniref:NAD(P)/FAD-dependent oxidoreductase n=1 Tax=Aromatoleum toluclasticum TaxID=92003 RepID=UPI000364FDA1|nr:FAD-dependent oxidoreductase [Aromatoleum toluclasticum]